VALIILLTGKKGCWKTTTNSYSFLTQHEITDGLWYFNWLYKMFENSHQKLQKVEPKKTSNSERKTTVVHDSLQVLL